MSFFAESVLLVPKLCMATVIQGPFAVAFRRPGFSSLAKSIFRC